MIFFKNNMSVSSVLLIVFLGCSMRTYLSFFLLLFSLLSLLLDSSRRTINCLRGQWHTYILLWLMIGITWSNASYLEAQTQKNPVNKPTQQKTTQQKTAPKQQPDKEIQTPQQDAQEEMMFGGYPVMLPPPLSPDRQLSIGVQMSAPYFDIIGAPAGGISVGYALSPALHVGMLAGATIHSDTLIGTRYSMALYGRIIFRSATIKPLAELHTFFGSTLSLDSLGIQQSQMGYGVRLNIGAQYFLTQHIGIRGMIALADVQLQTGGIRRFGIFAPTLGMEWFF